VKQLLIIRHAKAESAFTVNDFERKLTDKGKSDAIAVARRVMAHNITVDAFISSPAKRAKKTATLFCETMNGDVDAVVYISALYHAPPQIFTEVIAEADDSYNTIAIVAHNPGITYFVNELQSGASIDNMPTSGVFAVSAAVARWKDFEKAKKAFLFFERPML
jgi:phosphohistidine phosphatase